MYPHLINGSFTWADTILLLNSILLGSVMFALHWFRMTPLKSALFTGLMVVTNRQTDRQTDGPTDRQMDRRTDRWTDM